MQSGQVQKKTGRISVLLSLAILILVSAAIFLTYLAPPASAQTYPNFSGGWNGSRLQTGIIPTGLTPNSNQTLMLHQVSGSNTVVGTLSTYWPGTPYFWTSYASGTISGAGTMSLSWTVTAQNMPAGTGGCGETLTLGLTTGGGVTTATVPTHHPCGSTATTINSYALTLVGWQKMFGTQTSGCSRCGYYVIRDSIDASTGNIVRPSVDYETAGPNKLMFMRYYNGFQTPTRLNTTVSNFAYVVSSGVPNVSTNFDLGLAINGTIATAYRPDGQQLIFFLVGGVWTSDSDVDMVLANPSGNTWTITNHDDSVETYTASAAVAGVPGTSRLNSIKTRNGYTQTMAYNGSNQLTSVTDSYGRALTFNYTSGYLTSVTTPDALVLSYSYSSSTGGVNDRIASVSYNTSPPTSQTYNYANSSYPFLITSVTDENGNAYKTFTYDSYGRALSEQTGTGANADLTTVTYNDAAGTVTETNALGQSVVETFSTLQGSNKPVLMKRTASASVPAATTSTIYDSNGYLGTVSDWNGYKTVYTNNAHGDPTTVVEASGTAVARTTTIAYDTTWVHLPATITTTGLTTSFTYDTNGNPLTKTQTDTTTQTIPYSTNGQTRTTNFTWSNFLPATVQTPNGNTTTFTFGTDGALTNIKNALLQNTQITSHTGGGLPLTIVDPNGVTTTLTYNPRNWLLTSTLATGAGNLTTTNTYDAAGELLKVQKPDGSYLTNAYDTAHRLTTVTDSFGNSINYTLDAGGNRTASNIKDPSGTLTKGHTATYDTLGRKLTDVGGVGQTTTLSYDDSSALNHFWPPGLSFPLLLDQLNRETRMQFNSGGGYNYTTYDDHNRVLTRIDQASHTTSWVYDGFGEPIQQISPDTGTTVLHYDADGNLTQKVDAAGITMNKTYDVLDRPLTTTFPASTSENVSFTYDQTGAGFSFGIGRLTSVTDQAGSLTRAYDERGNLLTEKRVNGATTLTTYYTYDAASRVLTITYPDTSVVTYTRDAMGRITAVSDKPAGAGSATTLASSITYKPFGPWAGLTFGNGIVETPTWDLDYRLTALTDIGSATVQSIGYSLNPSGQPFAFTDSLTSANNITSITMDTNAHILDYVNAGGKTLTYDLNGNRKTLTGSYTNTYTTGGDQLATVKLGTTTTTVSTNANGNITGFSPGFGTAGVTTLAYNNANRLSSVSSGSGTLGSYVYDAFGNRFSKTVGANTTLFTYAGSGLLAETTGGTATNYIYLNGRPLAMLTGSTFTYLHDDKLGTPRVATNASQTVVWKTSYAPFGETLSTFGSFIQNLRFPGQYFDSESGFNHNGFRDYVPQLGRYLEADPIGIYANYGWLNAGMNPYLYVGADPMRSIDPLGLMSSQFAEKCAKTDPNTGWYQANCDSGKRLTAIFLCGPTGQCGTLDYIRNGVIIGLGAGYVISEVAELMEVIQAAREAEVLAEIEEGGVIEGEAEAGAEAEAEAEGESCAATLSFRKGTEVATPKGFTKIEDIKAGDKVIAFNFAQEKAEAKIVTSLIRHTTQAWVKIAVGGETIAATGTHPFWVEKQHAWVHADELKPGMELKEAGGKLVKITSVTVEGLKLPEPTFNFEVANDHNYFAGAKNHEVLVHNAICATGNVVYQATQNGVVVYVGITSQFAIRAAAHLAEKGITIVAIDGLADLSAFEGRAVEQVLINTYKLGKNGGTLLNKINSIASSSDLYKDALIKGAELLKGIGY